jgi:hypothetical protein
MSEQPPLTPEQLRAISDARRRARTVRRAGRVATFDAWTTAVFAVSTLLYVAVSFAFAFSPLALVVGMVMVVIAYNSFMGAGEIKRFEVRGAKRLGINQLVFFSLIAGYCIVRIVTALMANNEQIEALKTYFVEMYNLTNSAPQMSVDEIEQMVRLTIVGIYATVIVASLLVQGLTAVYYFSRAKHIRRFKRDTPNWVVQLMER